MNAPPNIDEFGNLMMLRQAIDVLEAEDAVQRGLYPSDRDPADEMRLLFRDAWQRVRPVFGVILEDAARASLERIDLALDDASPGWAAIRRDAAVVSQALPNAGRRREPRAWLDQIVRWDTRLCLRRQSLDGDASG